MLAPNYTYIECSRGPKLDKKNMPDRFQALPGAKTPLKHTNIFDLYVDEAPKSQYIAKHMYTTVVNHYEIRNIPLNICNFSMNSR